ncbi:S-layer homology domain-containing protein [Brevibacillus agri]|uniref:S-layer homology domain-containing protein n=1 Tax=Brevibacillus TaxID=55080 RepID=UPI002E1AD6F2|nr:S-layer homology domain-containing protein [Brevibacillus borstelensis]
MDMKKKICMVVVASTLAVASVPVSGILLDCPAAQAEASNAFTDIENHWAKEAIVWAVEKGITKGYEDATFKPNNYVSEAEFLALLIRTYNAGIVGKGGYWADPYYEFAKQMNYPVSANITSETWGDPAITRRQVAEIIAASQGVNYNSDDSIRYLLTIGIASGSDPKSVTIAGFKPDDSLTRAEAVQLIRNLSVKGKPKLLARPVEASDPSLLVQISDGKTEKYPGADSITVTKAFVNGNLIESTQGEPMYRSGVLYVPLQPIAEGMGDSFAWEQKPYVATVTINGSKKITVTVSKANASVDGKQVPVSALKLEGMSDVVQAKPVTVNNQMYLPYDFLKNVLGYPVEIKQDGSTGTLIIGTAPSSTTTSAPTPTKPVSSVKVDPRYPLPNGTTIPQITSKWTSDKQKNMQILTDELGFTNLGAGVSYRTDGTLASSAIGLSASDRDQYDTMITFSVWMGSEYTPMDHKIPYIAKEVFDFYLPKEGNKLWRIADDAFNGKKGVGQYFDKILTFENRQVKLMAVKESLVIIIGMPGVKYDSNWKAIK